MSTLEEMPGCGQKLRGSRERTMACVWNGIPESATLALQCCTSLGLQRRDIHGHRQKLLRAHRCRCYARNGGVNIESIADGCGPAGSPTSKSGEPWMFGVFAAVDEHGQSAPKLRHAPS